MLHQFMRERNHLNAKFVKKGFLTIKLCRFMLHQFMRKRNFLNVKFVTAAFLPKENMNKHVESVHEEKKPFERNIVA